MIFLLIQRGDEFHVIPAVSFRECAGWDHLFGCKKTLVLEASQALNPLLNYIYIYLEPKWGPLFWLEFRPCFGGLTFKNRGQLGSRYRDPVTHSDISSIPCWIGWIGTETPQKKGVQSVKVCPNNLRSVETCSTKSLATKFLKTPPRPPSKPANVSCLRRRIRATSSAKKETKNDRSPLSEAISKKHLAVHDMGWRCSLLFDEWNSRWFPNVSVV